MHKTLGQVSVLRLQESVSVNGAFAVLVAESGETRSTLLICLGSERQ
jgi:hypothetical protein